MWDYLFSNTAQNSVWETMSTEEKNRQLFHKQKAMLDLFMEKGAISREQHDRSLSDLTRRMSQRTIRK